MSQMQGIGEVYRGKELIALVRYRLRSQKPPDETPQEKERLDGTPFVGTLDVLEGMLGVDAVFEQLTLRLENSQELAFNVTSLGAQIEIQSVGEIAPQAESPARVE